MARGTSIRTKLIAVSTLLMVGVIGLFSAMHTIQHLRIIDESSRSMQHSLRERLRQSGTAQLQLMAEVTRLALVQSDFITLQAIVRSVARDEGITAIAVVGRFGRVLAHGDPDQVGRPAAGALRRALEARGRTRSARVHGVESMFLAKQVRMEGEPMGTVVVAYSLRPLQAALAQAAGTKARELRSAVWRSVLVGLLALAVGVVLVVLQGLRLSRPIQQLARQADKMATGDLGARVAVRSGDELGRLGERFNYMAGQMQVLVQEAIAKATVEKELELAEASRLAEVGRLAAGVAHEVNNPLTYAKGNLQLLVQELAADEELVELAREALHGVGRIQNVVRQLSEFARTRQSSLPGRVHEAARSAAKMAMVQLRDRARLDLDVPELPPVTMEESKLAQVLLNLLVNSAQAIPTGNVDENRVRLAARLADEWIEIEVLDSGPGIPPAVLPHVFESFFTTKQVGQGYGLGLSISRTLIRNAGGDISAESAAGGGARFVVRLPVHHEAAPAEPQEVDRPGEGEVPTDMPRRSLLLVDDDPEVLRSLERMLEPFFHVTVSTSGRGALELLEERGEAFDAVLCDIMMPDGSGLEVVEALEQSRPELLERLVLMTGGTPGIEREAAERLPVLAKPFELRDLLDLLETRGPGKRDAAAVG